MKQEQIISGIMYLQKHNRFMDCFKCCYLKIWSRVSDQRQTQIIPYMNQIYSLGGVKANITRNSQNSFVLSLSWRSDSLLILQERLVQCRV